MWNSREGCISAKEFLEEWNGRTEKWMRVGEKGGRQRK